MTATAAVRTLSETELVDLVRRVAADRSCWEQHVDFTGAQRHWAKIEVPEGVEGAVVDDGGTRVTQTRDVTHGTTAVSKMLVEKMLGGEPSFEANLLTGMKQTLVRIKDEAEQTA